MKHDHNETIGTCESCGKDITETDKYSNWEDGPITCEGCTPSTSWNSMNSIPKDRSVIIESSYYEGVISVKWDESEGRWKHTLHAYTPLLMDFIDTACGWMDIPE